MYQGGYMWPYSAAGVRYGNDQTPKLRGKRYYRVDKRKTTKGGQRYTKKKYMKKSDMKEGGQNMVRGNYKTPELMSVDNPLSAVELLYWGDATPTPCKILANGIATGAGFYQRRGRKVALRSLRYDIGIQPIKSNSSAMDFVSCQGRLVVIYDRQANGATPTFVDVFGDVSAASATPVASIWANTNLNNRDRFQILADEKFILPDLSIPTDASTNVTTQGVFDPTHAFMQFSRYIKFKNVVTQYGDDTAQIGSIQSGALWVWFFRDGPDAPAVEPWTVTGSIRLRYADP